MAEHGFPTSVKGLTSEWLTEMLHGSGVSADVSVCGFSTSAVSDPGQTSEVVRIALDYTKDCPSAPSSVIGMYGFISNAELAILPNATDLSAFVRTEPFMSLTLDFLLRHSSSAE